MRVAPLLAVAAALLAGVSVQADFAGVDGFSGRVADCSSCHTPSASAPPATVALDGLPDAWSPGETYLLTVTVAGGPPAMPPPQPQGGFELEVAAGRLGIPDEMDGLLRQPTPTGMTYTPEGTLMRTWNVTWTAPGLEVRPAEVPVWLAVVSANGNHVIATNRSDLGELGDQVATLTARVPPEASADAAWRALPLLAPEVEASPGGLEGRHADANATHLAYRVDGGAWTVRPTGPTWRITLEGTPRSVEVQSRGADRESPVVPVTFDGAAPVVHEPGTPVPDQDAAGPAGALPLLALVAALFLARSRSRP